MNQASPDDYQNQLVIIWLKEAQETYTQVNDYPPEPICKFLFEFCKVFKKMGKLLGIAFSDIQEKVQIIRDRCKDYEGNYIEKSKNILECNGDNNSRITKDKTYKNYISCGRSLLRMLRFMDYLKIMFSEIDLDRQQKISDACSKAYITALYPYHTFLVQTAAKAAMMAAPNRQRILEIFVGSNKTDEQAYTGIKQFLEALEPIRVNLWLYYKENMLTDLP